MSTSAHLRRPLRAACAIAMLALLVAVPAASSADTGSLAITTTGPGGSAVTGACFEVLRGSESADSFCATSLGATRTLPAGSYTLKETTAPQASGRVLRKAPPREFTIGAGRTTEIAVEHVSGAAVLMGALMPDGGSAYACFEARVGGAVEDRACTGPTQSTADLRVPAPALVTVRQTHAPDGHLPGPDVTVETALDTTVSRTTQMRVAPGAVRVEPVDAGGDPLTGGCWGLYAGEEYKTSDCDADDDGAVRFTRLVPGDYVVKAFQAPPGYRRSADVPVTVGEAEEVVRPAHEPMGATRVRAIDGENGPLVPGACWTVRLPDEPEGQVQRACDADDGHEDGITRFDTLEEGDYVMWSGGVVDGFEPVRERQSFSAGADDVTLVFVLRRRGGGGGGEPPAVPVNSAPPAVSGDLRVGGRLTGGNGTWTGSPTAFAYQWERCDEAGEQCVLIPDATQSHYTLAKEDAHRRLRLVVTASNGAGAARAASQPTAVLRPVPPVNVTAPRANILLNTIAAAGIGRWTGDGAIGYRFQWLRCDANGDACSEIPGATLPLHGIDQMAEPYTLRVRVTATDSQGSTAVLSSASRLAGRARPINRVRPSLAPHGKYFVGDEVVARPGTWEVTNGPIRYEYRWRLCDANGCRIDADERSNRYEIQQRDDGHRISALVIARGRDGETTEQTEQILFRRTPPVNLEPPAITGTLRVGERVTAHPGRWLSVGRDLRYEYTWVRCESDGGNCRGATDAGNGNRYRIQPADWGRTLKVTVRARDTEGSQWAQSTHTAVIEAD